MRESSVRGRVIKILRDYDPMAVENPILAGTPDVECTLGWIELKVLENWPKKEETFVRVPHFTAQQRVWLKRRWKANQRAWLLLKIGQSWLLLSGRVAAEHLGHVERAVLERLAIRVWNDGLVPSELIECLKSSPPSTSDS